MTRPHIPSMLLQLPLFSQRIVCSCQWQLLLKFFAVVVCYNAAA